MRFAVNLAIGADLYDFARGSGEIGKGEMLRDGSLLAEEADSRV